MDMRAGRAHTGYQRYLFDGKSRFKEATGTFVSEVAKMQILDLQLIASPRESRAH